MAKLLNIQKEVQELREEVMQCFRITLPDKQFGARMLLALVWLHMIVKRIERSRDLNEKRELIKEFSRSKKVIKKGARLLLKSKYRVPEPKGIDDDFQAKGGALPFGQVVLSF